MRTTTPDDYGAFHAARENHDNTITRTKEMVTVADVIALNNVSAQLAIAEAIHALADAIRESK